MPQTFLGKTFEYKMSPQVIEKLRVNEENIAKWQANVDKGIEGNWADQVQRAKADIYYYTQGKGYQEALQDWRLGVAEEVAKPLGITGHQLLTNPQLAEDPRALAQYTGKPYGGVDYTPGSADWYKLNPTEAPGYKAPATQTLGTQTGILPTEETKYGLSSYTGVSIVDYLKSVGQPNDYTSRSQLAQQYGIQNYTGTAEQNTQLLATLRAEKGAAVGTSETARGQLTVAEQAEKKRLEEDINKTQAEITRLTQLRDKVTLEEQAATSTLNLKDIQAKLGVGEAPKLPNYLSDYEALIAKEGTTALQTQINSITKEQNDLAASLRQGLYNVEGKLAPMENIGTRQREMQRQAQEQMDELTRRKSVLVDELNMKNTLISNIMNLSQQSYQDAKSAFDTSFNQSIALMQIENTATNTEIDNARANFTAISKVIGDKNWSELEPEIQSSLLQLGVQMRMPSDLIKGIFSGEMDNFDLKSVNEIDGTFYFAGMENGKPVVKSVQTGTGIGTGGVSVKPPTQAEQLISGYATRIQESGNIIDNLENIIAKYNPIIYWAENKAPNWLKSSTIQSIEQAERNFVNSVLRRESGAAISDSEFDNAKKQYFPLPGDSQNVLDQKRQNRQTVLQNLINASGSAYQQIDNDPLRIR